MMPVAILCGGLGTRLGALTAEIPKSLVDVGGQPFIVRQFDLLRAAGYDDLVLLIGHLGDQIRAVVGDGSQYGVRVRYVEDGPELLGQDGALQHAARKELDGPFFALYGDSYLECDYAAIEQVFRTSGAQKLLTTYRGVDYGLRAFSPKPGHVVDYPMTTSWQEIGSVAGLEALRLRFRPASVMLRRYADLCGRIDPDIIEEMVAHLVALQQCGGRLAILGVGGSAANASHAVNDFRKLCRLDAMAPTDNVAELTARTNDDGWPSAFAAWLACSRWTADDAVLVFSVGGGTATTSANIARAVEVASGVGSAILGVVGPDGGVTAAFADVCLQVPVDPADNPTPYVESLQSIVTHILVNHPAWGAHD